MATDIVDVAFDEGVTLQLDLIAAVRGESSVGLNSIEFVAGGVMVTWSADTDEVVAFVPHSNIKAISQVV